MQNNMLVPCEIFIAMNEAGDWIVTDDVDEAIGNLLDQRVNQSGGTICRVVKVTVHMSPAVLAEAQVTVPDEAGTVTAIADAQEG